VLLAAGRPSIGGLSLSRGHRLPEQHRQADPELVGEDLQVVDRERHFASDLAGDALLAHAEQCGHLDLRHAGATHPGADLRGSADGRGGAGLREGFHAHVAQNRAFGGVLQVYVQKYNRRPGPNRLQLYHCEW
jgi:hypothetical protein